MALRLCMGVVDAHAHGMNLTIFISTRPYHLVESGSPAPAPAPSPSPSACLSRHVLAGAAVAGDVAEQLRGLVECLAGPTCLAGDRFLAGGAP